MERIEFPLCASPFLGRFLTIIYLATLGVLLTLPVFYVFKILGLFFLVWRFLQIWKLQVKRTARNAVIKIWQDKEGRWGFKTKHGHCARGKLKGDSFKCPWGIILRLNLKTRTQDIVIPVDSLTPFQFRTLCMRLNFFCD